MVTFTRNGQTRQVNVRVSWSEVELPIPVGFWSSVGNSGHGFVVEPFVDELAHEAGQDLYQYRRALLTDHPRHRAVLDAVAEAADWDTPPPEGRARGIAVVESFGSFVAEVSVRPGDNKCCPKGPPALQNSPCEASPPNCQESPRLGPIVHRVGQPWRSVELAPDVRLGRIVMFGGRQYT